MKRSGNLYAVILAGGSGTRFWPMSRDVRPKQFLEIVGPGSLYQQTIERIGCQVPAKNILIVTNARYKNLARLQAKKFKIPTENFLFEPQSRNTAAAIGWAARRVHSMNPEAVMVVLPSDHRIVQPDEFLKHINEAVDLAQGDYLVAFGVVPTRPETGYGYLKIRRTKDEGRKTYWKVVKFVEKPPLEDTKKYLQDGNYLWNSGVFVWKASAILAGIKEFLPQIDQAFKEGHSQPLVQKVWKKLPAISIDQGVLERARNLMAVKTHNIGWSDVGSWEALYSVSPKDAHRNVLNGDVIDIECERVLVQGNKKLVVGIGLKDLVIVDTPDALLVCRTSDSQKVRDVIAQLKKKKRKEI